MDPRIINDLINKLNSLKETIKNKVNECRDKPKVIIIGITGSGKSSLANSLSNREAIIRQGAGNKTELVGPGIFSGGTSGTKEPSIIVDNINNIVIFDCPGFEDTEGYIQEIINSFAIDYLLKLSNDNKIKILLSISSNELELGRGQGVMKTIERIVKMFPNPSELQQGLGIVFTKGDHDMKGDDFIDILNENPNEIIKQWCQFFKTNNNNVFTFPLADRNKIGNQYDFADHGKLISFIKTNQITNPIHNIVMSDNATLYLDNLRLKSSQKVQNTIHELFIKLNEQFRNENSSSKLQNWLNLMNNLKSRNISKVNELKNQFPSNIPNSVNLIHNLEENEIIYSFIDEMLQNNTGKNNFKDSLLRSFDESINELVILKQRAEISEENERIRIENERILRQKQKEAEERQQREREMQEEAERIQREQEELRKQREALERAERENQARINQLNQPTGPSNTIERFGGFVCRTFGFKF